MRSDADEDHNGVSVLNLRRVGEDYDGGRGSADERGRARGVSGRTHEEVPGSHVGEMIDREDRFCNGCFRACSCLSEVARGEASSLQRRFLARACRAGTDIRPCRRGNKGSPAGWEHV